MPAAGVALPGGATGHDMAGFPSLSPQRLAFVPTAELPTTESYSQDTRKGRGVCVCVCVCMYVCVCGCACLYV